MKRLVLLSLLSVAILAPSKAFAGGFFLMDRGVRAAGRGSAYVAGADDPASLFYNPAGLSYSGKQLLLDAALPLLVADYTRIDGGGNVQPNVSYSQVPLPIPTLAYSDNFGLEKWTFGVGVWAPNAALSKWPSSVNVGGQTLPAPQRYSLIDLKGTMLANIGLGIAFRPARWLSLGTTLGVVAGSFAATTTMSACDGAICTQPEDPQYDALTQFKLPLFVAPAASFGAIIDAGKVRLGASFDIPYTISGTADLRTRMPSAAIFDNATLEGPNGSAPKANANIPFPWILRTGLEIRPLRNLRMEGSFVIEGWSRQQSISLVANDVSIHNVFAIGDYQVGPVNIPRHMKNTYSVRFGGEYTMGSITLRAGVQLETSAFAPQYLSALTLDSKKLIVSGGITLRAAAGIYLDGVFAFSQMQDVSVRDSRVTQPNPIRPESNTPNYIGNGDYHMMAFLIGGGLRFRLDERRIARAATTTASASTAPTATASTNLTASASTAPTASASTAPTATR